MDTTIESGLPTPLSFADFLEKMKDPVAADLVRNIKGFIRHFDERSSSYKPNPETDSAAVQDFFLRMESRFRGHPAWRGAGPEVIDQAIEGLEKYVMSKIWPRTFAASSDDRDRDDRYRRLAQALSVVELSTLLGSEQAVIPDEALLATATGELQRMDRYKAPRDKLLCLVNVITLVEDIVGAAARAGAAIGGADAFFPVFLLVVIRARLPRLASNIEYVRRYRARARLSGQFDYMLCNLESTALYMDTVDWKDLKLTQDEFLARLVDAGIPEADMELRALREGSAAAAGGGLIGEGEGEQHDDVVAANKEEEERNEVVAVVESLLIDIDGPSLPETTPVEVSKEEEEEEVGGGGGGEEGREETEASRNPSLLAIDIPEPVDQQIASSASTSTTTFPSTSTAVGLTPLGAGPQTPLLIRLQSLTQEEEETDHIDATTPTLFTTTTMTTAAAAAAIDKPTSTPPPPVTTTTSGTAAAEVVAAMVSDGTALVLEEEASGRLQHRHPWIYSAAEDLSIPDVRALLASYRDVVLKYEALGLSLQQQLNGSSNISPRHLSVAAAAVSADDTNSIGYGLLQKLTRWGRSPSPSSSAATAVTSTTAAADGGGNSSEIAAALQGKVADHTLLHSLFGSAPQQPTALAHASTPRKLPPPPPLSSSSSAAAAAVRDDQATATVETTPVNLLGDLEETEGGEATALLDIDSSNLERGVGSPALGLLEHQQQQPPPPPPTESLI